MKSNYFNLFLSVFFVSNLSLTTALAKEESTKESKASAPSTIESKETTKETGLKESPKEPIKEQSKDSPKESVKEGTKEGAKDGEGNTASQLPLCKGSYSKVRWTECHGIKREFNGPHFEGQSYDGEFKEGRPHGHGDMRYHNGTRFIGNFEMGVRDGAGAEYAKDGSLIREGFWRAGVLVRTFKTGAAAPDGGKESK
jgi:hypothetical protein